MMLQARGIAQVDFRNLSQYVGNEIKDFIHLLTWYAAKTLFCPGYY